MTLQYHPFSIEKTSNLNPYCLSTSKVCLSSVEGPRVGPLTPCTLSSYLIVTLSLATLYQAFFRGRLTRGCYQSLCLPYSRTGNFDFNLLFKRSLFTCLMMYVLYVKDLTAGRRWCQPIGPITMAFMSVKMTRELLC